MSQKQPKKEIELTYQPVESKLEDIERALNKAFDFLFECVTEDYQSKK